VSKKEITRNSAVSVGFVGSEEPTDQAELIILLFDATGRREPVRWQGEPVNLMMRWPTSIAERLRRPRWPW
jgi:hypothetical protein